MEVGEKAYTFTDKVDFKGHSLDGLIVEVEEYKLRDNIRCKVVLDDGQVEIVSFSRQELAEFPTRRKITERLHLKRINDEVNILSGTIQEVADNIRNLEERLWKENSDVAQKSYVQLNASIKYDYDEGGVYVELTGIRDEYDSELSRRVENAMKQINQRKESRNQKRLITKNKEQAEINHMRNLIAKYGIPEDLS
jgi:hypothetical protein